MAHYLADTSLIIDLINRQEGRRAFLQQLLKPEETVCCCTINVIEVYSGMRPGEEEITARWLDLFVYRDVTREIAGRAGAALPVEKDGKDACIGRRDDRGSGASLWFNVAYR